jgi:type II secretory pathway component PulM
VIIRSEDEGKKKRILFGVAAFLVFLVIIWGVSAYQASQRTKRVELLIKPFREQLTAAKLDAITNPVEAREKNTNVVSECASRNCATKKE